MLNASVRSLGRRCCVLLAAGVALAACGGPSDLIIGGVKAGSTAMVYLSPTGSDDSDHDGSLARPWLTFRHALPLLQPGSTLTLLAGKYDATSTGYFDVTCDPTGANAATYPGPQPVLVANGTATARITVVADPPRAALLDGDVGGPPFFIDSCSYWTFQDLYAKSDDFPKTSTTIPDAGSVMVVGNDNHDLRFGGILVTNPNRYVHSHLFRIDDRSHDVTVADSELYAFHHNAFETSRTTAVKFLRNYINSRATTDIPGAYQSEDASEGDYGIFLEETNGAIAANNVIESVADGIGVVGRYVMVPAGTPAVEITQNQVLGNVVYFASDAGLRIDSRCNGSMPCTDVATRVTNTTVENDAFIGGSAGISSAGAVSTNVSQLSIINAANGLQFATETPNRGIQSTSKTVNTFADVQDVAFFADQYQVSWSFDHCAAVSANPPDHDYQPDDGSASSRISVDPATLGSCLVYLPAQSPLKRVGAGGQDVGANVLTRYDDEGQATAVPLWDPTTGVLLSCGAVAMNLFNKDLGASTDQDPLSTSCLGVQRRLNVGTNGCPLP